MNGAILQSDIGKAFPLSPSRLAVCSSEAGKWARRTGAGKTAEERKSGNGQAARALRESRISPSAELAHDDQSYGLAGTVKCKRISVGLQFFGLAPCGHLAREITPVASPP